MNMVLDATPVPFINPINQAVCVMPFEMVQAYVPYAPYLRLEEAAKVAAIRDEDEANSLLLSISLGTVQATPEGCAHDELSVEAPSLR